MKGDFFDRLDEFMAYMNLNDNQMTVKAGLSVGALGKQRKGSRGLSNESIAKILHSYPELDANWLLTGDGEMLKEAKSASEKQAPAIEAPAELINKVCELSAENALLRKEIGDLKESLKKRRDDTDISLPVAPKPEVDCPETKK